MTMIVVAGLPATTLLGTLIIPLFGWRPMFVIAGIGALIVWVIRKYMPESPRWLESKGRLAESEKLVTAIEQEAFLRQGPDRRPGIFAFGMSSGALSCRV
jgi:putative MFS transporter